MVYRYTNIKKKKRKERGMMAAREGAASPRVRGRHVEKGKKKPKNTKCSQRNKTTVEVI